MARAVREADEGQGDARASASLRGGQVGQEQRQLHVALRGERIEEDLEPRHRELRRAFCYHGRPRLAGATLERARVNVTRSIRLAIECVAEFSPELGGHFEKRIKTGWLCCYMPDTTRPINWRL
jgi:hypothetical protein